MIISPLGLFGITERFGRLLCFFLPYEKFGVFSPLFVDSFNELLHAGGAFLLHFFSDMAVHIQGKGCCGMARMLLHSFDIVTGQAGDNSIEVPLRYNYDKPEKPRISRVFGYQARFFILFQPEKSSREVVIS